MHCIASLFLQKQWKLLKKCGIIILVYRIGSEKMNNLAMLLSQVPATGNVEQKTYIIVLVIAAVLIIGAVAAGVISKKKK